MTQRTFRGCDKCHTTVPGDRYPTLCEVPDGGTAWLCAHCKVSYGATRVPTDADGMEGDQ